MVYLQDPVPLPFSNNSVKLRMGRTTLSLQAKRNWSSTMRNALGSQISSQELDSTPTAEEIQDILASSNSYTAMKEDLMASCEDDGTMAGDMIGAELGLEERQIINVRSHTMRTLNDSGYPDYGDMSMNSTTAAVAATSYATPVTQRGGNAGGGSSIATRESGTEENNRFSPRGTVVAADMMADVAALAELEEAEIDALAHDRIYDAGTEQYQANMTTSPPHSGGRIMEAISNSASPSPVPHMMQTVVEAEAGQPVVARLESQAAHHPPQKTTPGLPLSLSCADEVRLQRLHQRIPLINSILTLLRSLLVRFPFQTDDYRSLQYASQAARRALDWRRIRTERAASSTAGRCLRPFAPRARAASCCQTSQRTRRGR